MEWVEVTSKTVAQAEELALDRLGVDRSEAEFSVVDEPKSGLLGLRRTDARIRARVRPIQTQERKPKNRGGRGNQNRNNANRGNGRSNRNRSGANNSRNQNRGNEKQKSSNDRSDNTRSSQKPANRTSRSNGESTTNKQPRKNQGRNQKTPERESKREKEVMEDPMSLDEQGELVTEFLGGLLDAFELSAAVEPERVNEETVEIQIDNAEGVGLLIGPKGNTLRAIEDLSRMLVQRKSDGNCEGRIRVDIGGYRERRREALEAFCQKVAAEVRDQEAEQALEPMNAADRKIVHDVVSDIDGVSTVSEGQEPRRWVVIIPD